MVAFDFPAERHLHWLLFKVNIFIYRDYSSHLVTIFMSLDKPWVNNNPKFYKIDTDLSGKYSRS